MLTDIEIAQQTKLRPIAEIAEELHVCPEELEPYGRFKAKLNDGVLTITVPKKAKQDLSKTIEIE